MSERTTPKLLIVDPNPAEIRQTREMCTNLGWTVLVANRSRDALKMYLQEIPEVILVEMIFPDGTGFDLVREIRSYDWSHSSRILIHSAIRGSLEIVREDARRAGADGILTKPFEAEKFTRCLQPTSNSVNSLTTRPFTAVNIPEPLKSAENEEVTTPLHEEALSEIAESSYRQDTPTEETPTVYRQDTPTEETPTVEDAETSDADESFDRPPSKDSVWELNLAEAPSGFHEEQTRKVSTPSSDFSAPRQAVSTPSIATPWVQPSTGIKTDSEVETIRGELKADQHRLLEIFSSALRERWLGRIRVEMGSKRWTEISVGDGLLWTISCVGLGPGIVDVAFQHGLVKAIGLDEIRQDLLDRGEQSAALVLANAGLSKESVRRVLELTILERAMTAFEVHNGTYSCRPLLPPDGLAFEAKLPLEVVICQAVERHFPMDEAIERYVSREHESLKKTTSYQRFSRDCIADDFNQQCVSNLIDGEALLDWIRRNPENPSALFVLLTKLEMIGAIELGSQAAVERFSLARAAAAEEADAAGKGGLDLTAPRPGADLEANTPITGVPYPDGDKELLSGPRLSAMSSPPAGELKREPTGPFPRPTTDPFSASMGRIESGQHTFDVDESSQVSAEPREVSGHFQVAARDGSGPTWADPGTGNRFETAGASGVLQQLVSASGAQPIVDESTEPAASSVAVDLSFVSDPKTDSWRPSLQRAIDRWDRESAEAQLRDRLSKPPKDPIAAAYSAWLSFAMSADAGYAFGAGSALGDLEQTIEKWPENPAPYYLVGLAALSLGNLDQATAHVDRALSLAPSDRIVNATSALLKAGYFSRARANLDSRTLWQTVRKFSN